MFLDSLTIIGLVIVTFEIAIILHLVARTARHAEEHE
jgi:hypothetical protein